MGQMTEEQKRKLRDFEKEVLKEGERMVMNFLQEHEHKVFSCEFCGSNLTIDQTFTHHPCPDFEDTERNVQAMLATLLEALWKTQYNQLRTIYKETMFGNKPFPAVPDCHCDDFKKQQDCSCVAAKKEEAYKEIIDPKVHQLLFNVEHAIMEKRQLMVLDITANHQEQLSNIAQNHPENQREAKKEELERKAQREVSKLDRILVAKRDYLVFAIKKIVKQDIENVGLSGRRPIDPVTLTDSQIQKNIDGTLKDLKHATFLCHAWGNESSAESVKEALILFELGVITDMSELAASSVVRLEECWECLEKSAVFLAIIRKLSYCHESFDGSGLSEESKQQMQSVMSANSVELVEKFKRDWASNIPKGETDLRNATAHVKTYVANNPAQLSQEMLTALKSTRDRYVEFCNKGRGVMESVRVHANNQNKLEDFIFDKAVALLNDFRMPLYDKEDVLKELESAPIAP